MNYILISGPLLFFLLILHAATIKSEQVEDEREFDYGESSEKGPSRWGDLKPEWVACKIGKMQSPINLLKETPEIVPNSEKLKTAYKPSNAILKNSGHDISIQWSGDAGSVEINGIHYALLQAHWHTPSEHTINGIRYDLERHMVHSNKDTNATTVIAQLYEIGEPDPFLSKLMKSLSFLVETNNTETNPGIIDPNENSTGNKEFYRYEGSLTTPGCREGVIWTVKKKISTVSRDQVKLLQDAVDDYARENARPLQPVNGRDVHLYVPEEK